MKVYQLIVCWILPAFLLSEAWAQDMRIDSSFANSHYKERLAYFKQMPDLKKEIVFLGNSITEAGPWQEVAGRKRVQNRGISGDVTFGVIHRLDEVLAAKPAKVFILIGINDLKRGIPVQYIAANYERIARSIQSRSPKTKVYFQSVLPVAEAMLSFSYSRISNDAIDKLNQELLKVAQENGCTYVNLHDEVFADTSGTLKTELTTDGLHLKPSAYILWAAYLRKKHYL